VPLDGERRLGRQPLRLRLQPDARLGNASRPHLRDLLRTDPAGEPIRIADHCYGCTAGQGSSCGGALEATAADANA
jgi:hypothetical protein